MSIFSILFISIALSVDSFVVSIGKSLTVSSTNRFQTALKLGVIFATFHFVMILTGWYVGDNLSNLFGRFDHWIAFVLLSFVGVKAIHEAVVESKRHELENKKELTFKDIIILAVATSVDALVVGGSFAFLDVLILFSALIVSVTVFFVTLFGFLLGTKIGSRFGKISEIVGGLVLIIIGLKFLVEHYIF